MRHEFGVIGVRGAGRSVEHHSSGLRRIVPQDIPQARGRVQQGRQDVAHGCLSQRTRIQHGPVACRGQDDEVSEGVLGDFPLLRSGLTEMEKTLVNGLAGNTFELGRVSLVLRDLYTEGTTERHAAHWYLGPQRQHKGNMASSSSEDPEFEEYLFEAVAWRVS